MIEKVAIRVFGGDPATENYQAIAKLSKGYQTSIAGLNVALLPSLKSVQNTGIAPKLLEVGGGSGRSGWALREVLKTNGIKEINLVGTEPVLDQIKQGKQMVADKTDVELFPPLVQAWAEGPLPFPEKQFDAIFGSQMIHWLESEQAVSNHFLEAFRVLKHGGKLTHATSGIVDLGQYNVNHFTRHPFVLNTYLPFLKEELIKEGYWKNNMGDFVPWNPSVNPAYYKFTLNKFEELLKTIGFMNIKTSQNMAPLDKKEIEMRLTNLAFLNMHFFAGSFAEKITPEKRVRLAKKAYESALKTMPDGLDNFDTQPQDIFLGQIPEGSFGEPVPVITADKPSLSTLE